MKFAIFALSEQRDGVSASDVYKSIVDQAVAAEELGYDAIWLAEHHFTKYGVAPSIPVLGAAVAEHTSTIRIGSGISVLPFHDPRRLAEDYAMLDVLSGGRLDFGCGRGYQPAEFAAFGVSMEEARERFEESVEVIDGLWRNETFSYHGKFFEFEDLSLYPRPVQSPPPIWLAAVSPSSFVAAAKAGRPFLSAPQITPLPKIREGYDTYRRVLGESGWDDSSVTLPLQRSVYVADSLEAARSAPAEAYMWYSRTNANRMAKQGAAIKGYEFYQKAQGNLLQVEYDRLVDDGSLLFGTPDTVAAQIETLRDELGLNYLICWMNAGGLDHQLVLEAGCPRR
jgi:natural product biosynthesis luciferase-like monooxygenase protein